MEQRQGAKREGTWGWRYTKFDYVRRESFWPIKAVEYLEGR